MSTFIQDLQEEGVKGKIYYKKSSSNYFYYVAGIHFGVNHHTGVGELIVDTVGLRSDGTYQKQAGSPTHHSLLDCLDDERAQESFQLKKAFRL